jgi:antitoxin ParD1/3/4
MGAVQKLSISVTEELAREIDAAIESGDYSTTSEVVRDALRTWKRERTDRDAVVRRLRQLWEEGLASGEPEPMPEDWAAEIIARGHARLEAKRKAG